MSDEVGAGIAAAGRRLRVGLTRALRALGLGDDAFLLFLAVLIGVVTGAAAVGFHELIDWFRSLLYEHTNPSVDLYGKGVALLILIPAVGGLIVGIVSRFLVGAREGHGIIDVMESVIRSRGVIKPSIAIEKIATSAVTIGSGGSAGAEGPIVQIGAAIASGIGQVFSVGRTHLPVLIGCGSAAGISAIFNSPFGGVLFALEVILRDFSVRIFAPVVIASVIANVTTQALFQKLLNMPEYKSIFHVPLTDIPQMRWGQIGNFVLLGLACGVVGVGLTRAMNWSEHLFAKVKLSAALKPAMGGAMLGITGVAYVMLMGWVMLGEPKPIGFHDYSMPAFFGDGYGVVQQLLDENFYSGRPVFKLAILLAVLVVLKLVGTCLTLSSGGSGGIIAPSLFLGGVGGALMGVVLKVTGIFPHLHPQLYALVGMGAVLAAVVHAPLSAILILLDVTGADNDIILPAMLASVTAVGTARFLFADSIYTMSLRERGVRLGSAGDMMLLRRMSLDQVSLEPASAVRLDDPLQHVLDLTAQTGTGDYVVMDKDGVYAGMVVGDDVRSALMDREAIPLLLVSEVTRAEIPLVRVSDDLATVMDTFSRHDVSRLPVCVSKSSGRVIGLISRSALMRQYQTALSES